MKTSAERAARAGCSVLVVLLFLAGLATIANPAPADAAAQGSLPFTISEHWDVETYGSFIDSVAICRYLVLAEFDEAYTYTKPGSDVRYARIFRPGFTGLGEVRVSNFFTGDDPLFYGYQLEPVELPPGKYAYGWYGRSDSQTSYKGSQSGTGCSELDYYQKNGNAAAEAAAGFGVYPPPGLQVAIVDGPPLDTGVPVNTEFAIVGRVLNNGATPITDLALVGNGIVAPAGVEVVSGPDWAAPTTLAPGEFALIDWTLKSSVVGPQDIKVHASGTIDGGPVSLQRGVTIPVTAAITGEIFRIVNTAGNTIKEGEGADVRLRVENHTDEPLSDVSVDSVTVTPTDTDGLGRATAEPATGPDAKSLSGVLGTEGLESVDFADYRVETTVAGLVQVAMAVSALDPAGKPVSGVITWDLEITPNPLKITIDPKNRRKDGTLRELDVDNDGDGDIDAEDNQFDVEVTVANQSDDPITDLAFNDIAEPVDFSNNLIGDDQGAPKLELIGMRDDDKSVVPVDVGIDDLAKQGDAGDSDTFTFVYKVTGEIDADAVVIVSGVSDDKRVQGSEKQRVRFASGILVEVGLKLTDPTRIVTSGQVVRISGYIENLDEDDKDAAGVVTRKADPIVVMFFPAVQGNGIGGFLTTEVGGRTPLGADPIVVPPGERVSVNGILATTPNELRTDAAVDYLVKAWKLPKEPDVPAAELAEERVDVIEDDTYSTSMTQRLQFADLKPQKISECEDEYYAGLFTCNLILSLQTFAVGTWDLAKLIPQGAVEIYDAKQRVVQWYIATMKQATDAINGDPQAQSRLVTELEVQFGTFVELGLMSRSALIAIGGEMAGFLKETDRVLTEGDDKAVVAYFAKFLGENPDLGVSFLTKARTLAALGQAALKGETRSAAGTIIRESVERTLAAADREVIERLDEAVAKGLDPKKPSSGVFRGGEKITNLPKIWGGVYGAARRDVENLLRIAREEGVLIAFRSRSPLAAKFLEDGLAYLKFQAVKAKGVNAIDVTYLGFPKDTLGKVVMVEPPIPWNLKGADLDRALDGHMDALRARHPELVDAGLAGEVRDRLKLRVEKFPEHLDEWLGWGRGDGVPVAFDYDANGVQTALDVVEYRKTRVDIADIADPVTGEKRLQFTLYVADETGLDFRFLTGDIDIVGFFNLDRTPIFNAAKREILYEKMRSLLGMQHGDTLTWEHIKRDLLLRDHVGPDAETFAIAAPDAELYTGRLDEKLSSAAPATDADLPTTFTLVGGPPAELISSPTLGPPVSGSLISLADRIVALDKVVTPYLLPGALARHIAKVRADYAGTSVADHQTRGAPSVFIRIDGTVEIYRLPDEAGPSAGGSSAGPRVEGLGSTTPVAFAQTAEDDALTTIESLLRDGGYVSRPERPAVGSAGGSWEQLSLDDAVALGTPGLLDLPVLTHLAVPSEVSADTLDVLTTSELGVEPGEWFAAGDRVVVDPGGFDEEFATVVEAQNGRLVLDAPLAGYHLDGTTILLANAVESPVDPVDPVLPTDPMTPSTPTQAPVGRAGPSVPGVEPEGVGRGASQGSAASGAGKGLLAQTGADVSVLVMMGLAALVVGLAMRRGSIRRKGPTLTGRS